MSVSLSRLQAFYGESESIPLLRAMIHNEFKNEVALISSFGADSALLISLVAEVNPDTPILFLDTGKHFPETLEYVEQLENLFGLTNLRRLNPDPKLLNNIDPDGKLWQSQVNRCCWIRKVEPLDRELAKGEFKALITGRKRYQTAQRKDIDNVELFEDGLFRINPLCTWDKVELKEEFKKRNLPQHPLVERGYPSIGCAPCTREVRPDEDERAGRWAHTTDMSGGQKQECGIHTGGGDGSNWMGGGV